MAEDTPLKQLAAMRGQAVFRIFESKFKANTRITVGSATCENAAGANAVYARFDELLDRDKNPAVVLSRVGCAGKCDMEPVVTIVSTGATPIKYIRMTPERAERVFREHIVGGAPVEEFSMRQAPGMGSAETETIPYDREKIANRFLPLFGDVSFFGRQFRLTLRNCGVIDPESIDEYLGVMGYEALANVLETKTPADVVDAVTAAGLRGRGGGGFPTGMKWKFAAAEPGDTKYIICNADEGDPGAFMDRSTIEGDPHTIVEGMAIGSYAIGARQGYVYIRAEYPLAIERLQKAIADARSAGFLGKNILGSGWDFDIELRLGAGAFVCGEETALIHSIEGKRGMPRPRPPYPSVSGLWGKPTVINNVETFANIPVIILDGADWFASIGTGNSKGTKVFALAGDVANTGLIEVPMGTTLRDVVFGVGGGIKDGHEFKAVQTGGPAGGCLPDSELDTPIDYDSLARAGSIMGSGGMIVMNEASCMVNVAKFFIAFTQDESCGKCTPCREGTKRMLEILTRITEGNGVEEDIEKLLRLAETVKMTSLCGLGQAAPNPVVSTIKHFREEYEAHIREKRCPSGACRKLVTYTIDPDKCVGCTACARKCPAECISGERKQSHVIDQERCIRCGRCFEVCTFDAVKRN